MTRGGDGRFRAGGPIGSFSSHTYGGGLRFQFAKYQDVTGYFAYQKRTQDRTDATFGFSYGIHF